MEWSKRFLKVILPFLCPQSGLYLHRCLVFKDGNGKSPSLQVNFPTKLLAIFHDQRVNLCLCCCVFRKSLLLCLHPCLCCAGSSPRLANSRMADCWWDLIVPYLWLYSHDFFYIEIYHFTAWNPAGGWWHPYGRWSNSMRRASLSSQSSLPHLLNVPRWLQTRVCVKFWEISDWPVWFWLIPFRKQFKHKGPILGFHLQPCGVFLLGLFLRATENKYVLYWGFNCILGKTSKSNWWHYSN